MFCLATYATLGISKYTYLAVIRHIPTCFYHSNSIMSRLKKNEYVLVTKCDGAQ